LPVEDQDVPHHPDVDARSRPTGCRLIAQILTGTIHCRVGSQDGCRFMEDGRDVKSGRKMKSF